MAQRLHSDTFEGGATRHENVEASKIYGGSMRLRHPVLNFFMKKLLLLALISSAQAQSFNGTIFDLDSGRIQVINGTINNQQQGETLLQKYRRLNAELDASIDRLNAETRSYQQMYELREQTRLLRQIANQ